MQGIWIQKNEDKGMRAYVLHDIDDFRTEEVPKPVPGAGEVLLAVKAAGICGSDIPRIYRTGTYSYPLIPGHEFSGVVVETGTGVDRAWQGRRAGVFPMIPCGQCAQCRKKKYELCRSYGYLGSRTAGGFADYVTVPAWNLLELPETVTFEAAAMMEPMAVAVHALRNSVLTEGGWKNRTVAICGLGTIGLLLLMFILENGADRVFVIGNKDNQRVIAESIGISENRFCDVRNADADKWLVDKTGGDGVELYFDCVGSRETLLYGLRCTSPGGKIQLVGNPVSDMRVEKETYWKILRNQLTLSGSWNSSFTHSQEDDWHYVLRKLTEGRIEPERLITHRYSFEELVKGFELMRDKSEEYVKVMGKL